QSRSVGHRRQGAAPGDRYPARGNRNISSNVAKIPIEFSVVIQREQLRPQYGDGFQGAPLNPKKL
ncbi:MAG: hypothetical protein AABZ61_00785, partial [Bacteroidota bacterium]